jgi:asparagine synthase (glutamine-hydrolysing)
MCGIVGYLGPTLSDARGALERAAAVIRHRGPDDFGTWDDAEAGIALGHRRLSIIDLSPAGHQPMRSDCGRWVLAFNGEIYNHLSLRTRLDRETLSGVAGPPVAWRGHSDTETVLGCVSRWGFERTLEAVDGMFAIALWDRKERRLHLARDRMGEKPLYLGWVGAGLGFASELKALKALPGFDAQIDRDSLACFVQGAAVPAPRSIYTGIVKLRPGARMVIDRGDVERRLLGAPVQYWDFARIASEGRANPIEFPSDDAAVTALGEVLSASIAQQMLADVPLGAFLSGGIDSSTVVALMQAQSERPVKTFSIGFHEEGYNEAEYAKSVARHLRTDHAELYVDNAAAREVIPKLPEIYCEPFADSSQIPTYLVSQLARRHVTVSLSGDAGDELFGGYSRYMLAAHYWNLVQHVPTGVRRVFGRGIRAVPPAFWNRLLRVAAPVVPARYRDSPLGHKLIKGAVMLGADSLEEFYREGFASYWSADLVCGRSRGTDSPVVLPSCFDGFDSIERMMARDSVDYLPNVILAKVDRAAMAMSLETRVPMLSRSVVEFAWRLPFSLKVRGGEGKWILRRLLERHVPRDLIDRPKMGFGVPINAWLRGPLREWASDLLETGRLRREGFLDPEQVARKWREHVSGERDWQYHLWTVLMFQAWLEAQRS